MNLIKCENEHYYDSDKFDSCPHCANVAADVKVSNILGTNQNKIETVIPDEVVLRDYQKIGHRRITGWLVCIEGEMKGESFTLTEGSNRIGRAPHMDVALFREPSVSRENHAIITYESDTNLFTLCVEPNTVAPVQYNHQTVKKTFTQILSNRDILTLGECDLCFIPFCDEQFRWTDSAQK
ncbi:MAG: FHA domain-containing protein [Lachnospiraceae bacterium]|nr:FHA domain-containing protein [Lachnospiraceae bacterium]